MGVDEWRHDALLRLAVDLRAIGERACASMARTSALLVQASLQRRLQTPVVHGAEAVSQLVTDRQAHFPRLGARRRARDADAVAKKRE